MFFKMNMKQSKRSGASGLKKRRLSLRGNTAMSISCNDLRSKTWAWDLGLWRWMVCKKKKRYTVLYTCMYGIGTSHVARAYACTQGQVWMRMDVLMAIHRISGCFACLRMLQRMHIYVQTWFVKFSDKFSGLLPNGRTTNCIMYCAGLEWPGKGRSALHGGSSPTE